MVSGSVIPYLNIEPVLPVKKRIIFKTSVNIFLTIKNPFIMATKKAATKKAAKPAASKKVTVSLTAAQQTKAQACIKKSGKVTFGIKPISVTKVPSSLSSIIIMD
jgi:hypothetical protein